jgi:hypothetical protein
MEFSAAQHQHAAALLDQPIQTVLAGMDEVEFDLPVSLGANGEAPENRQRLKLFAIWTVYEDRICGSPRIRAYAESDVAERRTALVCALADLLWFKGALTVAALIVRESLLSSCKVYWDAAPPPPGKAPEPPSA